MVNKKAFKILQYIFLISLSLQIKAQVPPVPAAFPSNFSCTPGQLLYRQIGLGRITNIMYHNGHIYTNNVNGRSEREFIFTDIDDPNSLEQVFTPNLRSISDQGNHGHSKTGDYLTGYWSSGYKRIGLGVNDVEQSPDDWVSWQDQPRPTDSGSIRIYYPWSVPFNWLQYGSTPGTGRIYRADELLTEWEPLADHGIAGNSILLGNILFIASDASSLGVAAYDIGPVFNDPPEPPRLIDRLTGVIGGYLPFLWENYLVLSGGRDRDIMQVVDISDPTDMRLIRTFDLTGTSAMNAGTSVPYVQTQDQFVFARRHKIDMELLEIVLEFDEVGNNRPPNSVSGQLDVSQYTLPLGNLMISGGFSASGRDGIGVWCQNSTPDNRAPYVGYHLPSDGQRNFPVGAPISLVIAEELESFTIINGETIIVRPVGGEPVDAWTSFAHDGILTVTPREYLQNDTTYEVLIPSGGIKDAAGNGIEGYSFSFSTGGALNGTNSAPQINEIMTSLSPSEPGDEVTISVDASDPELDTIEYRFVYGDGTPASTWSSTSSVNHVFNNSGHFAVKVQVRDIKPDGTSSVVSDSYTQTVANLPQANLKPVSSSMIALDETARVLWVVNPDNDSITRINADTEAVMSEIQLQTIPGVSRPANPVSIALDPTGKAWIATRKANKLIVLNSDGTFLDGIDMGYGSAPQAVLVSNDGNAFVTLGGRGDTNRDNGQLVKFDTASREETGRLELGQLPRAMALNPANDRLYVAAFISKANHGEIWEVNPAQMNLMNTVILERDRGTRGLDTGGSDGPGVPNYIADLEISPDGEWLWYTAIKADTNRGEFFMQGTDLNAPFSHDSVVRSMLGRIDLTGSIPAEPEFSGSNSPSRIDVDNSESPSSLTFSPRGDYVFLTLQGNNTLAAFDDFAIREIALTTSIWRANTGDAPQASLFDPNNNRLWVKNFMSRDLSVFDMSQFLNDGSINIKSRAVSTVGAETLNSQVLAGKRTFYFAGNDPVGDNEMSFEGYISCASCHIDGSHDGRTWDFTQRGEGLRNTTDLRGRRGMGHGNVHWSANFDEIQDFVLDIVNNFGGNGFLSPGQSPHPPLGSQNNTGLSLELDQLSAYLTSLGPESIIQSPYRNFDGSMTADANAGLILFNQNNCASCHVQQTDYTDSQLGESALLHNVGTLRTSSGNRLGGNLTGIDTPTLLGVWESGPYFHDGSAKTLNDVFVIAGGSILQAETGSLFGGASIPDFIEINQDSSSHGTYVNLRNTGDGLTVTGVDGGSGGIGAIEIRLYNTSNRFDASIELEVNGQVYNVDIQPSDSRLEWVSVRTENVDFQPGETNVVVVRNGAENRRIYVDEIMISRNDDISQANAHRVAAQLSTEEKNQLMTYLRELDGSNSSFSSPDLIFKNGFE